ncbi:UNVERIFIED_CONTAM: hypothetical protein K2H54_006948 [Gekko kuhli]
MSQSGHEYDPINYMKKPLGPPPPTYTCFRCGKPGHYIKNCPTNGDKNFESVPRIKKSTGIPRSFMMEVQDPTTKGAMLTNTGKYAIPTIDAEAYAIGKKEKPPFLPEDPSSSSEEDDPIPDELLCLICKDIMTDAVVIPCCGNSYCDECIRTALLESEEHTCPTCHQTDVSPDALIANKFLRQAVNNFKNETGYTKRLRKPAQLPRPVAPRNMPSLPRAGMSRQQDPLMVPPSSAPVHAAASLALPLAPGNPSASGPAGEVPPPVSLAMHPDKPEGPFREGDGIGPAATLAPASEHSKPPSSLSVNAVMEEKVRAVPGVDVPGPMYRSGGHSFSSCSSSKGYRVPVLGQAALAGQLGPHGHSIPSMGQPLRPNPVRSAGSRSGWEPEEFYREQRRLKEEEKKKSKLDEFTNDFAKELMEYKKIQKERRRSYSRSKSPYSASSYSRSSYTYSKSRSGSSRSRSYSRSFSRSHSRSYSRSPPYPRRGRGKSRNYRSRSRSHGYHRSRSRSPPYRRYHSRSRSPAYRGQSPNKRPVPQAEGEREYFGRYREVPAYDVKAYYGRPVDLRGDLFEKDRVRDWECYRDWCEKYYKGFPAGAQPRPLLNRENFSPERFGPAGPRRENSPYIRGRRDEYPGGLGHRNRGLGPSYSEKLPGREGHGVKETAKPKEKEPENISGDGKGNRHKKHRKRRKGEEGEGPLPSTDPLEGSRKSRDAAGGEDSKPEPLFMLPSRDDATPVRDEPMEADSVAFKPTSDKERKEKPKARAEKAKRKTEGAATPKKDAPAKPVKAAPEKSEGDHEKSPRAELPPKKAKEEMPKAESSKSSSQKDEKPLGTPRKAHLRATKEHPETRSAKEEKAKKEHPKEAKAEKPPPGKEEKAKKPADRSKAVEVKAEKRKRKVEEKVEKADPEAASAASAKPPKPEAAEVKLSPKGLAEPEGERAAGSPEKEKTVSPVVPAKKIKLNRETGKKIVSAESVPPPPKDPPPSGEAGAGQQQREAREGQREAAEEGSGRGRAHLYAGRLPQHQLCRRQPRAEVRGEAGHQANCHQDHGRVQQRHHGPRGGRHHHDPGATVQVGQGRV